MLPQTELVHPLRMSATTVSGQFHEALAINEVALRQTHNAAHCAIDINSKREMEMLVCDGVLVATPAGPQRIICLHMGPFCLSGQNCWPSHLFPLSAAPLARSFAPANSHVHIDVIDPDFRPQSVTADNIEFRDIAAVDIWQRQDISIPLLYDPGSGLPERIISEQFGP